MKMPPGFEGDGKVCLEKLSTTTLAIKTYQHLQKHGIQGIPQEPCVMIKSGVIVFFYADDAVFCISQKYRRDLPASLRLIFLLLFVLRLAPGPLGPSMYFPLYT
jgi:hypothetical protein